MAQQFRAGTLSKQRKNALSVLGVAMIFNQILISASSPQRFRHLTIGMNVLGHNIRLKKNQLPQGQIQFIHNLNINALSTFTQYS